VDYRTSVTSNIRSIHDRIKSLDENSTKSIPKTYEKKTFNNNTKITKDNTVIMSMISVTEALGSMTLNSEFKTFIKDNSDQWLGFGTSNSHILRAKLMRLMQKASLTEVEKFAVYFFCARVKDKERILMGMSMLPKEIQEKQWFVNVQKFFNQYTVKWPKLETANNFATLHLPNTNPGLHLLSVAMMFDWSSRSDTEIINNFLPEQPMGQLKLTHELQEKHKEHSKVFWNETVKGTKNPKSELTRREVEKGFIEEYYNTSAGDQYPLIKIGNNNSFEIVELKPDGYNERDIVSWYKTVRSSM